MLRQKAQSASSQHGDVTEPAEGLIGCCVGCFFLRVLHKKGAITGAVVNLWPLHPFVELTDALAKCYARTSGLLAFKLGKYLVSFNL
jgi:hypothetical protein